MCSLRNKKLRFGHWLVPPCMRWHNYHRRFCVQHMSTTLCELRVCKHLLTMQSQLLGYWRWRMLWSVLVLFAVVLLLFVGCANTPSSCPGGNGFWFHACASTLQAPPADTSTCDGLFCLSFVRLFLIHVFTCICCSVRYGLSNMHGFHGHRLHKLLC